MDTKQLRQKILDLAIRGKLVPQDPNDEPASVLLERVKAEKERLIAEGKIKRSKKSASSSDKPHYADWILPNGWIWVRLDEICEIKGGKRIPRGMKLTDNVTSHIYIRVTDMKDCSVDMSGLKYITDEIYDFIRNYTISANDLYITIAGSIGRVGEIPKELHNANLTENAAKLTNIICDKKFLMYALLSDIAQSHFTSRFHQVAQPKLSIETASCTLIPLPPLNEQARIVNEIDHLFATIKDIDKSTFELSSAISQVKSKILELAINGKLVPQDPADEPAVDLLKRVNPNAVVPADTSHYGQLPNGWCYTTMNYICQLYDGEKIEDMELINLDAKYLRGKSEGNALNKGRFVPEKTTMILVDGENSGEIFTAPINGYQGSTFKLLDINEEMNAEYVKLIIRIYQKRLRDNKVGSAIPHLNKKMFREILVPVPPIAEQIRIVRRTYELMSKISELTEAL